MEPIIPIYTLEINQKSSFGQKGRTKKDFKINSNFLFYSKTSDKFFRLNI